MFVVVVVVVVVVIVVVVVVVVLLLLLLLLLLTNCRVTRTMMTTTMLKLQVGEISAPSGRHRWPTRSTLIGCGIIRNATTDNHRSESGRTRYQSKRKFSRFELLEGHTRHYLRELVPESNSQELLEDVLYCFRKKIPLGERRFFHWFKEGVNRAFLEILKSVEE